MSGVRWEEISEAAKDLVSQLSLVDSRSRMSAEDVLHGAQRLRGHCDSVLEMGLDNGKGGDKGVELEDWLLRKNISIKKSPPKYLLSRASVIKQILIWLYIFRILMKKMS